MLGDRPKPSLKSLREMLPPGVGGASAEAIIEAGTKSGLPLTGIRTDLESLLSKNACSILFVNDNHYIAYAGHHDDKLIVFDNRYGLFECNREQFGIIYRWNGEAIVEDTSITIIGKVFTPWTCGIVGVGVGLLLGLLMPVFKRNVSQSTTERSTTRPGFSLVELLVVIAIVALILGLTLAAIQRVRSSASSTTCMNNLRQISLALHNYHDSQGAFPPGVSYEDGKSPQPFMAWSARILPYLEQNALWESTLHAYSQEPFFEVDPPHIGFSTVLSVYSCPADSRTSQPMAVGGLQVALTSYLGVEGTNQYRSDGTLFLDSRIRVSDITDGTSNTLLVGERPASANGHLGWWYAGWGLEKDGAADSLLGARELNREGEYVSICPPGPYHFVSGQFIQQCDAFHFWSPHIGGANFLFADGSVHFLRYEVDSILPDLATRAGGESVSIP
jgi:prepilin-type N-terminal cleavage/methylation domain-containing protein/prepilin-type processing-associated H-X9-DG protein